MRKNIIQKHVYSPRRRLIITATLMAALTSCSIEKPWHKPEINIPTSFKESIQEDANWKLAQPSEDASRGQWWLIFGDQVLNELEQQAISANNNLQAAAARVKQSRALLDASEAARLPEISTGFGATRQRMPPLGQTLSGNNQVSAQTLWRAQVTAAYEVDLFGRVSTSIHAAQADAERTGAVFQSVLLALQADVAQSYYQLRELDAGLTVFRNTVLLREKALQLFELRFNEGDISELEVTRARNLLESARADTLSMTRQRVITEHRLAVLLGKAPVDFNLVAMPLEAITVKVPAGLPSSLLERRPDIAAAERAMAAANARVGLARTAFFPKLDLTAMLGYQSDSVGNLFNWSNRTFLLGPLIGTALSMPLFDGGRRKGLQDNAEARLEEDVSQYRQQVLVAFKEVEDSLAELRLLDEQIAAQKASLTAALKTEKLSNKQYKEGQVSHLEVIDAQRQVLQSRLQLNQLVGAQAAASVSLIRALGGGWG